MFPITATERLQDLQREEPAQLVQEMVHSYFPEEPCLTSCPTGAILLKGWFSVV